MQDELCNKLRMLEADYPGQPIIAQQSDLKEINQLREQLGMPPVDAKLNEIGAAPKVAKPKKEAALPPPDHTEAREVYQAYLKKVAELEVHRKYADQVARATSGPGQTPVRPLATMGTDGGPLLCDQCNKPIILEGGKYQGVNADVAWRSTPNPPDKWVSWISGGMVVEIALNGTLRIYHGYPGQNNKHCCNVASRNNEKAQEKFKCVGRPAKQKMMLAFLEHEFSDKPEKERYQLLRDIMETMFSYDPGIGVNRPPAKTEE